MKAVILAAGSGTRLRPYTYGVPKEMVRVGNAPCIEHVIRALKVAKIESICIVVGRNKSAIVDYIGSGESLGVDIFYKVQELQLGPGDALLQSKSFIGKDNYLMVMYGDNYFRPYAVIRDLLAFHYAKRSDTSFLLNAVSDPTKFGIVCINSSGKILKLIEKPIIGILAHFTRDNGNYLASSGAMILSSGIFDTLEDMHHQRADGKTDGEIWITDAVNKKLSNPSYKAYGLYVKEMVKFDVGDYQHLLEADKYEMAHLESVHPVAVSDQL